MDVFQLSKKPIKPPQLIEKNVKVYECYVRLVWSRRNEVALSRFRTQHTEIIYVRTITSYPKVTPLWFLLIISDMLSRAFSVIRQFTTPYEVRFQMFVLLYNLLYNYNLYGIWRPYNKTVFLRWVLIFTCGGRHIYIAKCYKVDKL